MAARRFTGVPPAVLEVALYLADGDDDRLVVDRDHPDYLGQPSVVVRNDL